MEMDGWFVFHEVLDLIMTLVLFYLGYSTWMGYRRTKNPSLRILSIVFFPAALIHITYQALEIVAAEHPSSLELFHHMLFIFVLGILAWVVRWQPGWKMPLKRQETR